jgi:DegV family protein with EDD domain
MNFLSFEISNTLKRTFANMNIRIVTDSTCDLPLEIVGQQAITVVPMYINVGDQSYLDGVNLTRTEFYAQLPNYFPTPKTAAPGVAAFLQTYERLADEGAQAILSIHISEALSATINSARIAAEQFTRIPVTVLDSSQLSLGTGFLVERAAQMTQLGKTMEEILSVLKEVMKRTYVFASLKTLEYLRRSGRMNFAIARFGEIMQIKPLLHMNMGKATAHRTRTQKRARARLLAWLAEYAPFEKLAILHAGVQEEAEALYEQVRSFFPQDVVSIVQITPALGAHLGIGALGFACISKE